MSDLQARYKLWDEFLKKWPKERLATMTLDEYTKAGSEDTFTNWLEFRLADLGSIRGCPAFRFGVYSRKDTEEKESARGRNYSETHGWFSYLGATAEEAFLKVRSYVVHVATLAARGDRDGIEDFKQLGDTFKWKVAFHYQNRQRPVIVGIFKPEALAAFTGGSPHQSMASLQSAALEKCPPGMGILEFGGQVLETPAVQEALRQRRKNQQANASAPPDHTTSLPTTSVPITSGTCINRIYYGPPGTGKTYTVIEEELKKKYGYVDGKEENPRYRFVTFHQSYGYEEFVEGLRPVLKGGGNAGEVQYEIRPGVFKELCDEARKPENAGQRFAMVIDEINRGNISKIFGELITLIEPDKREDAPNAVPITLPYSRDSFLVPANVDIIGTMNTADRSLALLDTALRRRFEFVPLLPDTSKLAELVIKTDAGDIDVPQMLERINERIEVLYDREHCIGHAYFIGLKDVPDGEPRFKELADIFRNRILPLLEEYFFEDWHKICLVLGGKKNLFVREEEQDLKTLFGNDHGLESYAIKRRYTVQEEAFSNPVAYVGIYAA